MVRQSPDPNPIRWARTFLFVPANRRDWLDGAARHGADAIVADLEDGVAAEDKDAARSILADWLTSHPEQAICARVNSGPRLGADLDAISDRVAGVFVPKATSPADLDDIEIPVVAMIESGAGWLGARDLAAHPAVVRLAAGEQDLLADLGADPSPDERELLPFRMHLVAASAATGIAPPVGPVHMRIADSDGLRASSRNLRRMGFGGRSAIHPAQITAINEAFSPKPEEVAWARRVIDLAQTNDAGAFLDDHGQLVDEAVIERARRLINSSTHWGTGDGKRP